MQNAEQRTIFHVDVNSAFLSWSALKQLKEDPGSVDLRTVPSAVGGDVKTRHGIITAKSIPAKKYGIQTGEPVVKALQKCPNLILVPSDFATYRAYSHALMDLLSQVSPILQQVSVDEAYLDVTDSVSGREDAIRLAARIRETVFSSLGFTVNVGISSNKLLAKMASDFEKPDRTHTLYPDEVPEKMWPLPINQLHGCGQATSNRLHSVGIHTIGQAAQTDLAILQSLLGEKSGLYIYNSANGISTSPVRTEREQAKSVSNETTLPNDLDVTEDSYPIIKKLSKKVAGRMQKAGLVGQTVTFQVKTSGFQRHSRQLSLPILTDQASAIESAAIQLANELLPELFSAGTSVRLIGVGVSKLSGNENRQLDLFSWTAEKQEMDKEKEQRQKKEKLDQVMKALDSRYGAGTIRRGIHTQD